MVQPLDGLSKCNEHAQIAGIEIGTTKAQAAQCPGIVLRQRMPQQEQAAQDALIDCVLGFSPRVEPVAPGVVIFDIEGTERIFGPPETLVRIVVHHAVRIGLKVNVAAARNPDTAMVAARGIAGTTVIAADREADSLAELPVDVLSLTAEQAEILEGWGIHRCGELAQLPTVPLVERLGQSGLRLQRLARGEIIRTLVPIGPPLRFQESVELENPVEDLESLAFVLSRLLDQISTRLALRSLSTDELRLRLQLEVHQDRDVRNEQKQEIPALWTRTLKLPVAMDDTRVLLKLLRLDLEQHGPGGAVKRVTLEARPSRRRYTQAGLFAALAPEPEKLEVTLARIRSVVGELDERGHQRVGSPEPLHSHRPDDFRVVAFAAIEDRRRASGDGQRATITVSMFRPPLPANVRCQAHTPVHISFAEVSSAIVCVAGPWTTSGNWWKREEQWRREEWDIAVQVPGGIGLYRIFRDVRQDRWSVEGLYD